MNCAFSCAILSRVSWAIHRVFSSAILSPELRQLGTGYFPVQCCLRLLGEHWTAFLSAQCCPKSINTTLNRIFFLVQWCLEPLGQHRLKLLLVQCCPKSIKTTLNRIFSCAMLSQENYNNIEKDLFLCNVFWTLLDNLAQIFLLCNGVPTKLRQHWTGFVPVQCCPKSIKTTLNRIFSCAMLSGDSWKTLPKVFK